MGPLEGTDFTLVELKDALRERGLSTRGAKAELIQRLSEEDPSVWTTLGERLRRVSCVEGSEVSAAVRGATEGRVDAEDDASIPEECPESVPLRREEHDDYMQRELALIRRERELIEREQQLLRREREVSRSASATSSGMLATGSVRNLKDLLPEFDATDNTFWRWKHQLELLRSSYQLDDHSTRILISSRLKGRALTWFYSKAEYLTLSIDDLVEEMQQLFDSRPGKLSLRKEFEARVWRAGEQFCDYYHDKVILANRVPVAEDELLDYLVDGIVDMRLQNQARVMSFQSRTALLRAFEKINNGPEKSDDSRQKKEGAKSSAKTEVSSTRGRATKCYRCHEEGHVATQCKRPAAGTTRKICYVCGSSEHLARDCSRRKQPAVPEAGERSAQITTIDCVQTEVLLKPYMVTVKISPSEKCGKVDTYVIDAMIDSGSPISLVRDSIIEKEICSPVLEDISQFRGINGLRLQVLNIFRGEVEVRDVQMKIKFYTVPDNTMTYKVLLGRDFLACPSLRITLGDIVKIENVEKASIERVMSVETNESLSSVRDDLQIDPAISRDEAGKIRELNKITIRNSSPTELIDDNIDRLRGKKYFILDSKDGFHHIKMHEASTKFTSFVTPLGRYEYLKMPFGLTNAPRDFQRFIRLVFEKLIRERKLLLYLDGILIETKRMRILRNYCSKM